MFRTRLGHSGHPTTADNNAEEGDNDIDVIVPQEQVPSPQSLQG